VTTRKTAARTRTAPKTLTTPAETGETAEKTNFDKFSEFRARAAGVNIPDAFTAEIPPYVLGPDQGFDPPVSLEFPDRFEQQVQFEMALRAQDYFAALQVLAGRDFGRIIHAFGQVEDSYRLLAGLTLKIVDHFTGRGAADVPGGSSPS